MAEELGVVHTAWQKAVTGLSRLHLHSNTDCESLIPREELLVPAARALAGLYR